MIGEKSEVSLQDCLLRQLQDAVHACEVERYKLHNLGMGKWKIEN